jgi:hypothetical protein
MKFLFLIYHDETVLDALPEGEMQTLVDSALDYDEEIRQSGHNIVSNALQSARTARTIRVRGGKVAITDGPFARRRSIWAGSSSSRPRTWTRRARWPRDSHRRVWGPSRCDQSRSSSTPS